MRPYRPSLMKRIRSFFDRLFCKRTVIVISNHKRDHYPIDGRVQLLSIAAVIMLVSWISYSTGNYMAAKKELAAKEKEIASESLRAKKIENEFSLLKRDLMGLMKQDDKAKMSDYSKFVIKQYENTESQEIPDIRESVSETTTGIDGDIIFARIAFLETTVRELREAHEELIRLVEDTTQGKIKELKQIIAATGLPVREIEAKAQDKVDEEETSWFFSDDAVGGPFLPNNATLLDDGGEAIYRDLKQLMLLHQVSEELPLSAPMKDYRLTSGFGVRRDPFTKKPAHHSGLDFAGPYGARVYAPADGVVSFSGRRGGYGVTVDIDHEYGVVTRYGHMRKSLVEDGQEIKAGDVIGIQGSSGRSTGDHLHYEVRFNNKTLNPKRFLRAGEMLN